jgi:hypothetical protein
VEISVNDRPIGRYSVRIDHEITDNLRPGFNRIAFTPIPDIDSIPVRARITVVYSQQPRGEPPVLTYDTTMISDNQEAITPPPPPKFGDFNSSYNGNAPVAIAPKPVLHADVMTLFAR